VNVSFDKFLPSAEFHYDPELVSKALGKAI